LLVEGVRGLVAGDTVVGDRVIVGDIEGVDIVIEMDLLAAGDTARNPLMAGPSIHLRGGLQCWSCELLVPLARVLTCARRYRFGVVFFHIVVGKGEGRGSGPCYQKWNDRG
jgi:hypothetical protein